MSEDIEKLRDKLHMLLSKGDPLYKGEILKVSQELDEQINLYYFNQNKEYELVSGY